MNVMCSTIAQRYPGARSDDDGVPFSSNPAVWQPDPTDPGIRAAMTEQLIASALRREAIAPMWEVNTAKMQQDAGDAMAGLTEAERAARIGKGATYDATTKKPVGQFRAVTLDLDGNGTITTAGKDHAANTVGFDWDDSGFNKQVAWVKPNDGFLFLDRDSNGVVTSGKELFSNSAVSDDYKGISTDTINKIALCAVDTPAKCLKDAQTIEENDVPTASDDCYEFNSVLRRFYAGEALKTPSEQAGNDDAWRIAA